MWCSHGRRSHGVHVAPTWRACDDDMLCIWCSQSIHFLPKLGCAVHRIYDCFCLRNPQVDLLVYLTDNTYKRKEIINMEQLVWQTLNFDLCWPTTMTFLRRLLQVIAANKEASLRIRSLNFGQSQLKVNSIHALGRFRLAKSVPS